MMDLTSLKQTLSSPEKKPSSLLPVKDYLTSLHLQTPEKSDEFLSALRECADASRDEDWREPLGDSGILDLAADILDEQTFKGEGNVEVMSQALRLCGNGCAEKDANRARMASRPNGINSIIKAITNEKLQRFGIMVLYNICLDYEDTQKRAIKDGVGPALFTLLQQATILASSSSSSDDNDNEFSLESPLVEHLLLLTELLIKHDDFPPTLPPQTITPLLTLTLHPNLTSLETYSYLTHILTTLLSHEPFQAYTISTGTVESLLDILEDSYSRFTREEMDSETAGKILNQLRKNMIIALSDISSNAHFTEKYPLESSPLLKKLHSWLSLSSSPNPPAVSEEKEEKEEKEGETNNTSSATTYLLHEALQTSSCIILGNVATSDASCLTLINSHSIHLPLIAIISKQNKDPGTIFSAVGMLRNLVLPMKNKHIVGHGSTGIWQALETRWVCGSEGGVERQVPYAVCGLGRILVKGCRENAVRLLENANSQLDGESGKVTTRLSHLLALYAKSDELPTQTEISRTLCELLRCISFWKRQPSSTLSTVDPGTGLSINDMQERIFNPEGRFAKHELIPGVIAGMVQQEKWPVIRSEGIFGLGLLAAGFGSCGGGAGAQGGELEKGGARLVWSVKRDWWPVISVEGEESDTGGVNTKDEKAEKDESNQENNHPDPHPAPEMHHPELSSDKTPLDNPHLEKNNKPPLETKDSANALVLVAEVGRRLTDELHPQEKEQLEGLMRILAGRSR